MQLTPLVPVALAVGQADNPNNTENSIRRNIERVKEHIMNDSIWVIVEVYAVPMLFDLLLVLLLSSEYVSEWGPSLGRVE